MLTILVLLAIALPIATKPYSDGDYWEPGYEGSVDPVLVEEPDWPVPNKPDPDGDDYKPDWPSPNEPDPDEDDYIPDWPFPTEPDPNGDDDKPDRPVPSEPHPNIDDSIEDCGGEMKNEERKILVEEHNKYRAKVAKGEYTIHAQGSRIKRLPTAARMLQLKYNCSLERTALKWARRSQCQMIHSNYTLGPFGENLYAHGGKKKYTEAAKDASRTWGNEIEQHGANTLRDWSIQIGHATQIFWDKTSTIGCGIIYCDNGGTGLVCHYYPMGNIQTVKWYTEGKTLSKCGTKGKNEIPHPDTGLCELK